MAKYLFTRKEYEELKKLINETKERLAQVTKTKAEAGFEEKGWHDSGFQTGVVEEMSINTYLRELQELFFNAEIIEPEEQNSFVKIGTGVIVEYEDGKICKYIVEGYLINIQEDRVSYCSPLGKALLGAKEGEKRIVKIGNIKKTITVKKIFPPSLAETIIKEG